VLQYPHRHRAGAQAMWNTERREEFWRRGGARRGLRPCDHALDSRRKLPLGAHLVTPRRGYAHHGIYVGCGRVVEYCSRGLRRGSIEEVALLEFSRGREIWVRVGDPGWVDRPEVVCRALSRLGEDRYDVLKNNCEHFCEWCVGGAPRSYQVEELLDRCNDLWRLVVEPLVRMVLLIGNPGIDGSAFRTARHQLENSRLAT
jgi:hypothetical protein